MSATTTETPTETPTAKRSVQVFGNFGDGKYSAVCAELYRDIIRLFNFSPLMTQAVCNRFSIDCGQLDKANAKGVTIGRKVTKDGFVSLKSVMDKVSVKHTPALGIAFLVTEIDKLRKAGLNPIELDVSDDWRTTFLAWSDALEKSTDLIVPTKK